MSETLEVFKRIKDYPDYEISNFGRVKSYRVSKEGRIMTPQLNSHGYLGVCLYNNSGVKTKKIHILVTIAFLNHVPDGWTSVINHIDFNRSNNRVQNLEITTTRINSNKKHLESSSIYTGVSWKKVLCKWVTYIHYNGKDRYLGYYHTEELAGFVYRKTLDRLDNFNIIPNHSHFNTLKNL